jgi:hypothetical protein
MYLTPQSAPSSLAGYERSTGVRRRSYVRAPERKRRRASALPTTIGSYIDLGAITPDAAAQQAMPQSAISKTPGFTQSVYDNILQAAQTGQFASFDPGTTCKGASFAKPVLTSTIGGLALKFGAYAGPAAPFVLIAGGIATLFGAIFGHHAQAVAKERQVICAAVPAAQDSLSAIDGAVQNGTITPEQAQQALDSLLSSFTATVKAITKNSSSQCNAACTWIKQLTAIVALKKSQYADLATQQAANPVSSAAQSLGLPPLVLYAAAGFVLSLLL